MRLQSTSPQFGGEAAPGQLGPMRIARHHEALSTHHDDHTGYILGESRETCTDKRTTNSRTACAAWPSRNGPTASDRKEGPIRPFIFDAHVMSLGTSEQHLPIAV